MSVVHHHKKCNADTICFSQLVVMPLITGELALLFEIVLELLLPVRAPLIELPLFPDL